MSRAQLTSTVEQNTGGAVAPFVAGKNKIINGDFGVWQRGTSFTNPVSGTGYTADRFMFVYDGSGATRTISQQTFTPSAAGNPPNCINGHNYFMRVNQSVAGSGGTYNLMEQRIEGAILGGQTVTFSFWAKASSTVTLPELDCEATIGGTNFLAAYTTGPTITTSWARYTWTFTMPSFSPYSPNNSTDYVGLRTWFPNNTTYQIDFWGIQLEQGSVATPFTTASGTLQGELALCQRYYQRINTAGNSYAMMAYGIGKTNTQVLCEVPLKVSMRTIPTSMGYGGNIVLNDTTNNSNLSSIALDTGLTNESYVGFAATATTTTITQFRPYIMRGDSSSTAYLEIIAEL